MFIEFEKIDNFRDLSPVITADGKAVKSGLLYRCGDLSRATDKDVARLRDELHISCVIDFRDQMETREFPDRLWEGVDYLPLPALPPAGFPAEGDKRPEPTAEGARLIFPQIYRELASSEEAARAYRAFFTQLLAANGKPVLWHCKQGKDRTGVAAVLLLAALGVADEQWRREYLLTNQYMQNVYNRYLQQDKEPWKQELMRTVLFVREDWLEEYLKLVNAAGGLDTYIHSHIGLSEAEIQQLRDIYLTSV